MKFRFIAGGLALALLASLSFAGAKNLEGRVVEKKLENGLTVLALSRPGAPVVTLQMTIKAGSVDERQGATGIGHLLEHMLFKGTEKLGTADWEGERPLLAKIEETGKGLDRERRKGGEQKEIARLEEDLEKLEAAHRPFVVKDEIDGIYSRNGGVGFNAFTTPDFTSYIVSLPSNRIELWAAIESDRMRNPVFREYYVERRVVMEERLQRRESEPGSILHEELLKAAFPSHPYRNPVIGLPEDLETLDIDEARRFHSALYGPDNAVIVAVGSFDEGKFIETVERYFADIPPGGRGRAEPAPDEPPKGPKEVKVSLDAEPRGILAYRKPTLPHRDDYVLDVVDGILSGGRTSRLWRALVDEKKLATGVYTSNGSPGARYENLFTVYAEPAPGIDVKTVLDEARRVMAILAKAPPEKGEMEKVIKGLEADRVRGLVSDAGLARRLSYFQTVAGNWRYIEEHPAVLATVTPEEVSRVAAKYLTPENETSAVLVNSGEASK